MKIILAPETVSYLQSTIKDGNRTPKQIRSAKILLLLADGATNAEAAAQHEVAETTVERIIAQYRKGGIYTVVPNKQKGFAKTRKYEVVLNSNDKQRIKKLLASKSTDEITRKRLTTLLLLNNKEPVRYIERTVNATTARRLARLYCTEGLNRIVGMRAK